MPEYTGFALLLIFMLCIGFVLGMALNSGAREDVLELEAVADPDPPLTDDDPLIAQSTYELTDQVLHACGSFMPSDLTREQAAHLLHEAFFQLSLQMDRRPSITIEHIGELRRNGKALFGQADMSWREAA